MSKKEIQVLMKKYKNFKEVVFELLYPTVCVLCGDISSDGLCNRCKVQYPYTPEPCCMKCGKPIDDMEKEYCYDCTHNKKSFLQGRSIWKHSGNVKTSVYLFKFKNRRIYSQQYARLWVAQYHPFIKIWRPECIIPVPVHGQRKRIRGYNQAEVLAKSVSLEVERILGIAIPLRREVLYRNKVTIYQKKLDDKERRKNLKGAFEVRKTKKLPKSVLVVDDIYTTGATMDEISRILLKSGVEKVFFMTISIGQWF